VTRIVKLVAAALAVLVLSISLASCAFSGLAFIADKRVTIISPKDEQSVRLPVKLQWTSQIKASAGLEYAVFVDSQPMRPGQTIENWIPPTDSCHFTPGCPNKQWLAQRFVFITTQHELTFSLLPTLTTGGGKDAQNTHNVTIVLLDKKTGRRVGESAFLTTFVAVGVPVSG
jgi:hypothetical protein